MAVHRLLAARAAGIAVGILADSVLGDPRRGHPVAVFGSAADRFGRAVWRDSRVAGAGFGLVCVGSCTGLGLLADHATRRSPLARMALLALSTWTALGTRSLARTGQRMATELSGGDIPAARERLRWLCARDPQHLGADELTRATVESLAENSCDATVAPLFWAAVAGPAGVLGYRAANTLDAMVGYRNERFARFGWFCARLDDLVNLIPARLTALLAACCAPLVGGSTTAALAVWWRDADGHPSPNAGRPEAAFAGALGVRLGGRNSYPGYVEDRPVLGDGRAPAVDDIGRAARLSRGVGVATVALLVTAAATATATAAGRRAGR